MFTGKKTGSPSKAGKSSLLTLLTRSKYALLAPPILLALIYVVQDVPTLNRYLLEPLENFTLDLRMKGRAKLGGPPTHPDIQIVGINEKDLNFYGRWPWPRTVHARMLLAVQAWVAKRQEQLTQRGASPEVIEQAWPKVVAFDMLFPEEETVEIDQFFGDSATSLEGRVITGAMRDYDEVEGSLEKKRSRKEDYEVEVVTGSGALAKKLNRDNFGYTEPLPRVRGDIGKLLKSRQPILPVSLIAESGYTGFVDTPTDGDGVRRRQPMAVNIGGKVYPSLALQTVMLYWGVTPDKVNVELGKQITLELPDKSTRRIPINNKAQLQLNWRELRSPEEEGQPNRKPKLVLFNYSGFEGALHGTATGEMKKWPDEFDEPSGKILLIGQSAEGLTDLGATPLDPYQALVKTHAMALDNILQEDYLENAPRQWVALVWLLVSWGTLIILRRGSIVLGLIVPPLVAAGTVALAFLVFVERSLAIELFWPVSSFMALHMGSVFLRWKEETDAKQQIRNVFGTYISSKVMDQILQHPDDIKLGGDSKAVAILFSDIRGFTTISESMTEQELVAQLNEYFDRMVYCLNKYEGTLHKYIGDAVMAAWGDVTDHSPERLARDAVRSSLDMIDELETLNTRWVSEGRLPWSIGIGVNYGTVMVGNIGATQRREFTLIGDPVNSASRFEGLTKEFGVRLCVGETVEPLLGSEFITRPLGLIVVKGKTQALRVFEVMADRARGGEDLAALGAWADQYCRAFEFYLKRDFAQAEALFGKCLEERPGDVCAATYHAACAEFQLTPPEEIWNGVTVMKTK
jgi:adenylate cyclase